MKIIVFFVFLPFLAISQDFDYFLNAPVSNSAGVFAPGLISDGLNNRDFSISQDGSEAFYTIQSLRFLKSAIIHLEKINGKWGKPEVASFSGTYRDLEAFFSPDGKSAYFASDRPVNGELAKKDFDIWRVDKHKGKWGVPVHLGFELNSSKNEFYPSMSKSGNLYFTAQLQNGYGEEDIVFSRFVNGKFQKPELLDTTINTRGDEFNAFVDPDENFIIFSSYKGRKEEQGGGDLYISRRDNRGKWTKAVNMGDELNSISLDYCPFVSADKKVLYFVSNRQKLAASKTGLTYKELQGLLNAEGNTSDDIYRISFTGFLDIIKQ